MSELKRRRHSTEPSPGKTSYFGAKPNSKRQITVNDPTTATMSNQNPPSSSIFSDYDVQRLAQAVKSIMFDELRKELQSDLQLYCNNLTAPLVVEIENLKAVNSELKRSVQETNKLSSKVDDLEQHSRKSCIRVSGVPYSQGEDTTQIVCDIASKLNVDLQSTDISVSHRLPTKEGHKQIIARFTHTNKRVQLLKATKNIRQISELNGVGISQDLTKTRSKVAYLARQAVKQGKLKNTSVWDGKVFLTDSNDGKRIVTTETELNDVIHGQPRSAQQYERPYDQMLTARSPVLAQIPNHMMSFPQSMHQHPQCSMPMVTPQMMSMMQR